jgi:hypothetical protein
VVNNIPDKVKRSLSCEQINETEDGEKKDAKKETYPLGEGFPKNTGFLRAQSLNASDVQMSA